MGIYDRDYYRQTNPAPPSFAPRSVVVALIVVNVALWLIDGLFLSGSLSKYMAVHVAPSDSPLPYTDTLTHPWLWWQFLTAGFAHAPDKFQHILFNMLVLFFLGRDVEERYGSKEFLRLYLVMIAFASLAWTVINKLVGSDLMGMYGASGAISGVVVLYALNFPRRTLLLFFVIPMPAWVAGALCVLLDMYGAVATQDSNVAFSSHLAGAAFAFVYYWQRWNLTRLTEGRIRWPRSPFRSKPRLRVHRPEQEADSELAEEVDRVLEKISRQGETSLTAKERRTLEAASREYQRRGKGGPE